MVVVVVKVLVGKVEEVMVVVVVVRGGRTFAKKLQIATIKMFFGTLAPPWQRLIYTIFAHI